MVLKTLEINNNKVVKEVNDDKTDKIIKNLFKFKKLKNNKFRNLAYISNIRTIIKFIFLIFDAKKTFNYLKQVLIKVLIFQYFNLENYK